MTFALALRIVTLTELWLLITCGSAMLRINRFVLGRTFKRLGWAYIATVTVSASAVGLNLFTNAMLTPGSYVVVTLTAAPAGFVTWTVARAAHVEITARRHG